MKNESTELHHKIYYIQWNEVSHHKFGGTTICFYKVSCSEQLHFTLSIACIRLYPWYKYEERKIPQIGMMSGLEKKCLIKWLFCKCYFHYRLFKTFITINNIGNLCQERSPPVKRRTSKRAAVGHDDKSVQTSKILVSK